MAGKYLLPLVSLAPLEQELVETAKKAVKNAYCEYSNFPVGAAVLTEADSIFAGCNVENCSYGAAMCAERVAVFKAVSEGHRHFKALAIFAPAAPKRAVSCGCGICRQVIAEFGLDIMILKLRNDGLVIRKPMRLLLPNAFVPGIVRHAKDKEKSGS
jgi:cytidine deaminase